ncbi:hypothetical protein K402DRAFT_376895 [Aulographum hederae CBS 113979]|uniref:Kinetochore protein fta4 n=1 Tax=Aulographum hederae CBS 113979 TaxID=1176131 RepID=A0A6G1H1P1_9PEZI|nr:hypothetical protein K402DRAFT_376895 [Aulographum hederae CBS 113979]
MSSDTVVALKTGFIRTQTRILSQALQPSKRWRNISKEDGAISVAIIAEVTKEVNRLLRRHTKSAYSPLTIRHVAEQIDKLYWDAGAPDLFALEIDDAAANDIDDPTIRRDDELASDPIISKLPETWEDADSSISPQALETYSTRRDSLETLSARRAALRIKIATYKQVQSLLVAFKDPQQSVQPNLVTKDGELAAELAKSRTLSVRVGARLAGLKDDVDQDEEENDNEEDVSEWMKDLDGREKVAKLLGTW